MDTRYEKSMMTENKIYLELQETISVPEGTSTGWERFDKALDWLCNGTENVLDFGCGNGSLLFLCANRGTKKHLGIDLAEEAIRCAEIRSQLMKNGQYDFQAGSLERLHMVEDNCMDAVILSNIIDNLYPNDARTVLTECSRILKHSGKMMIKLNPYVTDKQVIEWNLAEIEPEVYDDGLILWNRKTEEWEQELQKQFIIEDKYEFSIGEEEQINRIFLILNK